MRTLMGLLIAAAGATLFAGLWGGGAGVSVRAYALPLLQDTIALQDFLKKTRIQSGGEALLGDAQLGRVGLQER